MDGKHSRPLAPPNPVRDSRKTANSEYKSVAVLPFGAVHMGVKPRLASPVLGVEGVDLDQHSAGWTAYDCRRDIL